ncbi:MAG: Diaminopimelate epimerase [Polaribacter sp. SA4-10]|nr:MAG: Diaminopimelate epimerase [Polaribacter sp. SA4-10]
MNITFYKYQGTGNDFVMIDNRTKIFPKEDTNAILKICDRNFGIGADGVILIENDIHLDFKMIYMNPDSSETFCGNGARCAVAFAKYLKIIDLETNFTAFDGPHYANIKNDIISLKMIDVKEVDIKENAVYTYTGTQHHVELVDDLKTYPVLQNGSKIRDSYPEPGSNVNFVEQINNNTFNVRTYEKGVENETLACGTGVTAVAIAMHKTKKTLNNLISLNSTGGELLVSFNENEGYYSNIFLKGPATFVFKGLISI